ncbi:MAG: DUF4255 domain-containing protein [Bryobacterales bacterium]|nr:DUF4255 domain-containing protein [Bryobacterales bacterium]
MSDYRAIGGVSATLRRLLLDGMEENADVTIAPPDADDLDPPRINLFLYRLEESASLKNQDLPGLAPGGGLGHPPLALELYYMLTAYAPENDDRAAQDLLGDAMRALHETPIVPRSQLDPSVEPLFESVRVCLQPVTLDDLTKIWSATTKPMRTSVCYRVTAVQIESRAGRQYNQPVAEPPEGGPRIVVQPMSRPVIRRLLVIRQGDAAQRERTAAYARIGDRLVIEGTAFASPTRVFLGEVDATASIEAGGAESRLVVAIPDDAGLQPGAVTVRVQADVMLGEPPTAHRGFSSNLSVFVLTPRAGAAAFSAGPPRRVTISGSRLFQEGRPCFTLIGGTLVKAADYASRTGTQIEIDLPAALPAGSYPVRVRVNGAESIDALSVVVT